MTGVLSEPDEPDNRAKILSYEAECLRVLRERLRTEGGLIRQRGRVVTEVGLRGWVPQTQLVCEFKESGAIQRWSWGVWTESVLDPAGDVPTTGDAQIFASIVITDLEE